MFSIFMACDRLVKLLCVVLCEKKRRKIEIIYAKFKIYFFCLYYLPSFRSHSSISWIETNRSERKKKMKNVCVRACDSKVKFVMRCDFTNTYERLPAYLVYIYWCRHWVTIGIWVVGSLALVEFETREMRCAHTHTITINKTQRVM